VGYQATVPGQQRGRRDQPVHPQLSRQQPDQRGQNRSIRPRGTWLADLATQDRDLVPQDRDLVPQHQQLGATADLLHARTASHRNKHTMIR
jgi:hypothetical protein